MSAHADLTGLAVVVLAAVICGVVMSRLRQPAISGYILAGILLGPSGLALVENRDQITVLADLGVLMLLFLVGMELSLSGFKSVWRGALVATLLQIAGSVGATLVLSLLFGWSLGLSVLLGFVIALSSTAVVIKMLEGMNILNTPLGKATVGVLIAQDLAFVPMMLILASLAGDGFGVFGMFRVGFSVVVLVLLILYLTRRRKISLPFASMVAGHRDLTPLRGLAFCFGAAALTGYLGLSPAYGAFLAGLVIGNSTERRAMMRGVQPIQSILMMVFFLSIGLLINLDFILANMGTVLLILFMVTVFKTGLNIGVLRLAREPWPHAFIAGMLLAQIGEFSFLLGQAGVSSGLIGREEGDLVIAVTALSLLISPLWLVIARRLMRFAILSTTSGREGARLLFGRQAPAVFAALDGLAGRTKDFINRILSQLPAGVSVWPVPKEEAPEREITDAEWEDIHTEIPEPPLPKKTPKRKKYTPVKKNDG
ncbi:MAG: cation:proton antiporter [Alphaproteobacteria bacterium]|jgi:CPA2 family monovalent cation:H+ antiporter-2|nr:cation:proton antiporter [Alphaproteobacteria bacterium]MDP7183281.1 cation:proton antiporter [Alphaproteobacteria bacterium]MDP7191242.1 cation:proton antiporter [Alphaproteobacteria bacterium]MDP7456851.1 cation:proton antiporter [Alphaproteobacteria bacterium]HJO88623.1 cation:proton antiporter [Alphaproteobacteria bacterium]